MTVKYELTKMYKRGFQIAITPSSLKGYIDTDRDTLDHIVEYEHKKVIVTAKPTIPNYNNYIVQYPTSKFKFFGRTP